jgi:rubrerythrin
MERREIMSITFNAFEIFEMAEQIERNGAKFYRKAAKIVSDTKLQRTLLDLAAMEDRHEKILAGMKRELSPEQQAPATYDPENEASLYLQAMADGHVFDVNKDISLQLSGSESVEDILKMAIQLEKDSIIFYIGLRDFVPAEAGREKIEDIIDEERSHIVVLSRKLATLDRMED